MKPLPALLLACWLASCSAPPLAPQPVPPAPPRMAQFTLSALPGVNPDVQGRPSPVELRIYELANADLFERAGYFELRQREQDTLGASMLKRTLLSLAPGEQRRFSRELSPATRLIAVMVDYRNIEHASWRAVVEVTAAGNHALNVRIESATVALQDTHTPPPPAPPQAPTLWQRLLAPLKKLFGSGAQTG